MGAVARRQAAQKVSVRVGALTVIALIAMLVFAVTAKNGVPGYVPGASRNEIKASFADTGPLRAGDEVRIAGVRAGFVEDIALENGSPVVDMRLDGNRPVYKDATVSLGARSALGQKYVELIPGTEKAGELSKGATIPRAQTRSSTELDQVLDTFDAKTREATGTTLREVGGGLAGRGRDGQDGLRAAPAILDDVAEVSRALSADDGADLSRMLDAADTLAGTLDGQSAELAALTRDLSTTLSAVNADGGKPLAEVLQQAPETLSEARTALQTLEKPLALTASATRRLRPAAERLGESTPSLRGLLREAVVPLRTLPKVSESLETAVVDLTPMLRDTHGLVGQAGTALDRARNPLQSLVPYLDEVINFFYRAGNGMSIGDKNGRWLRVSPVVTPEIVTGVVPVRTPTTHREAYPAPGTVDSHATNPLEVLR
ncbi:MlaD family protein [Nocardioides dubius]|uniref:Mce/MlaD domain-containing protein n=1 Tax=Nocardioides dubius TaxID=317019 RepID=A0ABP4ELV1_9ACTN